jgi:hypothetical protein
MRTWVSYSNQRRAPFFLTLQRSTQFASLPFPHLLRRGSWSSPARRKTSPARSSPPMGSSTGELRLCGGGVMASGDGVGQSCGVGRSDGLSNGVGRSGGLRQRSRLERMMWRCRWTGRCCRTTEPAWRALGSSPCLWSSLDLRAHQCDQEVASSLASRCASLRRLRLRGHEATAAALDLCEVAADGCRALTDATLAILAARQEDLG